MELGSHAVVYLRFILSTSSSYTSPLYLTDASRMATWLGKRKSILKFC